MSELKRTGLYDAHVKAGGKIVPFAGWELPVQYSSIKEEHEAVRNTAGMFDVSHMGEIFFSGPDALANVQHLVSNDAEKMKINRAVYSGLLYPNGTFVDDVLVYKLAEDHFLMVVNAANLEKDYQWMKQNLFGNVCCENASDRYTQIALQGPKSREILQNLVDIDLSRMKYYGFSHGNIAGTECIISRTGYTGEIGFELYFDRVHSIKIWDALMETGKPSGIQPAGLGCRDTLRLEAGMALYGNDIDDAHTPLEAGLEWIVKFDKDDFIGKTALLQQKEQGLKRHLVGIELTDRGIPRHGYKILSDGREVGEVTSGTLSISLQKPIGMGYIEHGLEKPGTMLHVEIRKNAVPGVIVTLPFYSNTR